MKDLLSKINNSLMAKNNKFLPFMAIFVSLFGIYSVVSMITRPQDIRELAANVNLGHIPSGCYYVRGDCTGPETRSRVGSCKPVLICPTKTPTPAKVIIPTKVPAMINCAECLSEGSLSLCLNVGEKVSSCSAQLENTFSEFKVCVSCQDLPVPTPTSTPSPTETPQPNLTPSPTIPVITPGS